ncbi:lymphocyte antigen 6G-like [Channa argus]|uniref:lymphocyte antigen 6G-like n=1 Tax=Channa argus TaxID=215402 RepID=UPI00352118D3
MQLHGVLTILFVSLSLAYGLKCYRCDPTNSDCTNTMTCPYFSNSCLSVTENGLTTKSCWSSYICMSPMKGCQEDLCNSAVPTGPSVVLLLLSSAIIKLFL